MSVLKLLEKKNLPQEDLDSSEEELSEVDAQDHSQAEDEVEESAFKEPADKEWKNRSRVLITSGRGAAPGFRLMIKDIVDLLPHSKKEVRTRFVTFCIGQSQQKDCN